MEKTDFDPQNPITLARRIQELEAELARFEQQALEHEQSMFHSFFEGNEAVKLLIDPETGKILDANSAAVRFYGYSHEALLGKSVVELNTIEPGAVIRNVRNVKERGAAQYRLVHRNADGERKHIEAYAGLMDFYGREVVLSIIHDVTNKAVVEQSLRESEELYRTILSNISDAVLMTDDEGEFRFVCPNVNILFGYSQREIEAMGNIDQLEGLRDIADLPFNGGDELQNLETVIHDKYGRRHDILVNVKKTAIHGATRLYSCRDFTERRQGEEALAKIFAEKELYRRNLESIFQSLQDGILTVTDDMKLLHCNDAFFRICGVGSAAAPGAPIATALKGCPKGCAAVLRQSMELKKPVRDYRVTCARGRGGETRTSVLINSAPLLNAAGSFTGVVLLVRDMTRIEELERKLEGRSEHTGMMGKSKAIQDIYATLERLADVNSTVLVTGESGTGKEMLVDTLHRMGRTAQGPLVKVNCAALSENLLESELFGHVKGAFTGAVHDKVGRFQAAQGGMLFLDEIGEVSPRIQLKLLRVLDHKEYERVGESKTTATDAQIVCATNVDLAEKVRSGEFREDLYYRLKVMAIHMPPLRARREDIPMLAQRFLETFRFQFQKSIQSISADALSRLMQYPWPGNVRELRNAVEHACILCTQGELRPNHLPPELLGEGAQLFTPAPGAHTAQAPAHSALSEFTRADLEEALARAKGNKAKAARLLGIGRRSLYRRLEKFGL